MGRDSIQVFRKNARQIISTHTPAWGATKTLSDCLKNISNFNSHARVGRDQLSNFERNEAFISTHTPAWGATTARIFPPAI